MAGLVPAIHAFLCRQDVDARHKAGHDEEKPSLNKALSSLCRWLGVGGDISSRGLIGLRLRHVARPAVGDGTLAISFRKIRGGVDNLGEVGDGAPEVVFAEVAEAALI